MLIFSNVGEFFKDFPQAILFITYRYCIFPLIIVFVTTCVLARCPTGWLCFNNSFFKEFMTAVTWNDAQQVCESLNSNLTSIHSAAESDFILGQVRSADTNEFWIGFTDRANEGSFEWVDGSDVTYTNWIEGQPDDFQSNQDCSIFVLNWNFGWDDGTCSSHTRRYICRKDIN